MTGRLDSLWSRTIRNQSYLFYGDATWEGIAMTLTHQEVINILGHYDDVRVMEIIETGATAAELVEAKLWLSGDKRCLGDEQPLRPAIVNELFEILSIEDPEWDEA